MHAFLAPLTARWHRLPRDARDSLFQLLVIGWTLLPHAAHLPLWCSALATVMLAWRGWLALRSGPLPSRWTVALVLVAAVVLTLVGERTLLGKDAGVTMLVMLVTLKTLEMRTRRDALVVFFLGFFLVLTNFLYSQSLAVALSMILSVWGLLTALVLAHMPVGRPPLARAGALAARAALLGAPVMVVLFLLFPRMAPLWGMPNDAIGRTGLSGTLRLGGIAGLANDDAVAMRVRFDGPVPPPQAMYFRGPVLGHFDGVDWTRRSLLSQGQRLRAELRTAGAPTRYEVMLEPSRLWMLPLLEATPDRPDAAPRLEGFNATLGSDLQWQLDRPLTERVRFQATAWLDHRHGPAEAAPGLAEWLQLPPGANPRTLAWAQALRQSPALQGAGATQLAQAVLRHVSEGEYGYSLEPGEYRGDAIDEFWLDRKVGFCEHFASAFVFIMRAMDVPARIVTGYQGTDPRPYNGWWVVRQSNAHAWAEYWQRGRGWMRADPTAAVAPWRVEQRGRQLAPAPGLVQEAMDTMNPELARSLRAFWEGMNTQWNQWVLNYSRRQQFDLLRGIGFEMPDAGQLTTLLVLLLAAAAAAGAAWAWWDRIRQDPWQRLQRRVQRRLAALGVTVARHDAPRARAERVRAVLGERGAALAEALLALERQRYQGRGAHAVERGWWQRFAVAARSAG